VRSTRGQWPDHCWKARRPSRIVLTVHRAACSSHSFLAVNIARSAKSCGRAMLRRNPRLIGEGSKKFMIRGPPGGRFGVREGHLTLKNRCEGFSDVPGLGQSRSPRAPSRPCSKTRAGYRVDEVPRFTIRLIEVRPGGAAPLGNRPPFRSRSRAWSRLASLEARLKREDRGDRRRYERLRCSAP
jgi:hypothetical protein